MKTYKRIKAKKPRCNHLTMRRKVDHRTYECMCGATIKELEYV